MGDDAAKMLRGGDAEEDVGFEDSAGKVGGDVDVGREGEAREIGQILAGVGELFGESRRSGTRGRAGGLRGGRVRGRGRCPRLRRRERRCGSCCGLLLAESAFGAGEKAADIFVVFHDDQDRDEQEACDDDRGSLPHEVEGEEREASGADDGG